MQEIVVEYTPSKDIMDTLWFKVEGSNELLEPTRRSENVVRLKPK